ncbi:hypothetical protein J4Y16_21525 [Escherichia coli]
MRTITMYNKENLKQAEAVYDKLHSITRKLKWEINKLKEQCAVNTRDGAAPDGTHFIFYDYIDLEIQNFNSIVSEIKDNALNKLFRAMAVSI